MVTSQMNILRRAEVEKICGCKKSSLYELMRLGKFPKPLHLGARAVGWLDSEIQDWIKDKAAKRDH